MMMMVVSNDNRRDSKERHFNRSFRQTGVYASIAPLIPPLSMEVMNFVECETRYLASKKRDNSRLKRKKKKCNHRIYTRIRNKHGASRSLHALTPPIICADGSSYDESDRRRDNFISFDYFFLSFLRWCLCTSLIYALLL